MLEHPLLYEIPFYKAVNLFEKNNLPQCLPLFIRCAQKGNLYAFHYIKYILDTKYDVEQATLLSEEQRNFLVDKEQFEQQLTQLPSLERPDSWLRISVLRKSDWLKSDSSNAQRKKCIDIAELSHYCSYAYAYLLELEVCLPKIFRDKEIQKKRLQKLHDIRVLDVSVLCIKETLTKQANLQLHVDYPISEEYDCLETGQTLASLRTGNLEYYICRKIYDKISSDSSAHLSRRKAQWQTGGAMMGNPELQFLESQKTKACETEEILWMRLSARGGHIQAICFLSLILAEQSQEEESFQILKRLNNIKRLIAHVDKLKQSGNNVLPIMYCIYNLGKYYQKTLSMDIEKVILCYEFCYQNGLISAGERLAQIFFEKNNVQKAFELSQKLLKANSGIARELLARYYFYGNAIVKRDRLKAKELLKSRYQTNNRQFDYFFCYSLYADLIFSTQNPNEKQIESAILLCQQGISKGAESSIILLAKKVIFGLVPLEKVGFDFLQKSLKAHINEENFSIECCAALAKIYLDNNEYLQAKNYSELGLKEAVGEKSTIFHSILGNLFERGVLEGFEGIKGLLEAKKHYEIAAKFNSENQSNLGQVLVKLAETTEDYQKAEEILLCAYQNAQEPTTAYNLSSLYLNHFRMLHLEEDDAALKSFQCLMPFASYSDPDIQHDLGTFYVVGRVCTQDFKKAEEHWKYAIELGSIRAHYSYASLICLNELKSESFTFEKTNQMLRLMETAFVKSKGNLAKHFIPPMPFEFRLGVYRLAQDPNKIGAVLKRWKPLVESFDLKIEDEWQNFKAHFKTIYDYLGTLKPGQHPSRALVTCFLIEENTVVFQKFNEMLTRRRQQPIESTEKNAQLRLLEEIESFLNQPSKSATLRDFSRLLNRMAHAQILKNLSSKQGAGSRVKWQSDTSSGEQFSYQAHVSHGKEFRDRAKGSDLQTKVKALAVLVEEHPKTLKKKKPTRKKLK